MKQIGQAAAKAAASRQSLPVSVTASQMPSMVLGSNMPPVANRVTDIEIPNSAWSSWTEAGRVRQLKRPLTKTEITLLQARAMELAPAVAPYGPRELDHVVVAISDMYSGFTSMRQDEEAAAARIDVVTRVLDQFPAWAIQKACKSIQMNGVWRNGKFDKQWPPNDSEIVDAVRQEARLYSDQHRSALALLTATVEP